MIWLVFLLGAALGLSAASAFIWLKPGENRKALLPLSPGDLECVCGCHFNTHEQNGDYPCTHHNFTHKERWCVAFISKNLGNSGKDLSP